MVDSVKNYGIAGASQTIELGKQGAVIDASDSAIISPQRQRRCFRRNCNSKWYSK